MFHTGKFQSTRPCGTRPPVKSSKATSRRVFQSTRPCGTRLIILCKGVFFLYFNPRAPVGRDSFKSSKAKQVITISIHAPLWDATYIKKSYRWWTDVYFNPRAPVGRDKGRISFWKSAVCISIHAPLWDATAIYCIIYYSYIFSTTILIQSIVKKNSFSITFYLNPISKNV